MDEANRPFQPTEGHELLNKVEVAQVAFRQAGDEAVLGIGDAEAQQVLHTFVMGPGSDVITKADIVIRKLARSVLDGLLPCVKLAIHEAAQIASGAAGGGHWGLGCEDHSHEGICKHYVEHLKDHMGEISTKATKLMQDCLSAIEKCVMFYKGAVGNALCICT